ncbi:DUF853 family protein [Salinirubellus salinus]|uniref:DUF853 family protein n=1 Tax=Salinirubellus salinus TaxID=1364945 RepID=A0A9E7R5D4_9EURY|nr:helicase HerA-like domain-containing protein [Salinirubellus salinus]UWM55043.1 DUF853 family protein [Salinirubellus salinus]
MSDVPETLSVTEDDSFAFPVTDVLTGRGFVTGKSGSGKSNTASVLAEELLAAGLPLLVVDVDGEYYGLKAQYELLHVGADERCDIRVGPEHADRLAALALEEHVPVVLDVSGFVEESAGREVVASVVRSLFARAQTARTPFLLLVEEIHEFVPEGRGLDPAGQILVRVAKRGRKRGLGLVGLSQRPAAVDKEFITQCDWLCFHRLTWQNDTKVVGSVLGSEYAKEVETLADGEALVRADWADAVQRVQFRRKRTFDAGATPDLGEVSRPEFRSVDEALVAELRGVDGETSDAADTDSAEVERLREQVAERDARIEELERRLRELDGDATPRDRGPARQEDDPVWEAGQLVSHAVGSAWRGLTRPFRRRGEEQAADPPEDPDASAE